MTSRLERLEQQRIEKIDALRNSGTDPYPNNYPRTHTAQEATDLLDKIEAGGAVEDRVCVAGRIMAHRAMGKSAFMDIRDGSGKIQLLFMNIRQRQFV